MTRLRASWNATEARLREIGQGATAMGGGEPDAILRELGFLENGSLSDVGDAYYLARFVLDSDDEAAKVIATVLKQQPSVNAFCEKLWGKGEIPVQGAVNLLKQIHHSTDEHSAKRWLELMNRGRLISYNRANPTIRILYNPNELVTPPEDAEREKTKSHVLSPETPFGNLLALKELLRAARGSVRWYEQHMPPKVLEYLYREIDGSNVNELRLLSGPANVTTDAKAEFKRFKADVAARGVNAEWRVLSKKGAQEIHGRFFITDGLSRNVPPLNSILKNSTDEILPSEVGADDVDAWWANGEDISTFTPTA